MKHVNYHFIISVILLIMIIFVGCKVDKSKLELINSADSIVNIDVSKAESFSIADWADYIKYVPLETTSECLIGDINRVFINENAIIIFDRKNNNVFLFDQSGKYIRKIGIKGQGPDEYIEFNDIYYDSKTNEIYAFERFKRQMFVYNLNGELKKSIDSDFSFNSFIKDDEGFWIYSCFETNNPNKSSLMYVDTNLKKVLKEYLPQLKFVNIADEYRFTEDINGNKYFFYPSSNIIYKLNDGIQPLICMDFQGRNLPYERIINTNEEEAYSKIINDINYVGFIENLHIINDVYIFNCSESNQNKSVKRFFIFADLGNKQVKVYDKYSNTAGSPNLSSLLCVTKDDELVYTIVPQTLMDFEIRGVQQKLPFITNESNPILVYYKMKRRQSYNKNK